MVEYKNFKKLKFLLNSIQATLLTVLIKIKLSVNPNKI
jgi:hypothetical protein